jgi:hypothetical protein
LGPESESTEFNLSWKASESVHWPLSRNYFIFFWNRKNTMGRNYRLKLQLNAILEFVRPVDEIPRPVIAVRVLLSVILKE